MSFDRKIDHVCSHEVIEEALFPNPDRVTLRPLRPIASSNSVRVRVNGEAMLPMTGLQTTAIGKGALPGPYNIRAGVNDTLVVSIDSGPDQTVTLPAGRSVSARQLSQSLTTLVSGAVFQVTRKNQIQGQTFTRGKSARLMFKTGSTVASTLGLTLNRAYRGQQVYPRWSLINDPNTLSDRPTRLIVFDEPLDGTNDFFEINYTTLRQECRRCGGVGIENDWRYNLQGDVTVVRNAELLIQEILKVSYTGKGSNPFHVWYGTNLIEMIGKKLSDQSLIQNLIMSDLQDAFSRWQSVKKQQEETVGQFVSDEEYPFRLLVVNLETDANDPTIIYVNGVIQNRSNQPIQVTRGLKLPVPLDILGSTVQQSLLQENKKKSLG